MSLEVENNRVAHRFEVNVDGHVAVAAYRREGDTITFTHTEVPDELGGQGVGGALVRGALEQVRDEGLRVIPSCRFVASYIDRHPEYQSLLAEE